MSAVLGGFHSCNFLQPIKTDMIGQSFGDSFPYVAIFVAQKVSQVTHEVDTGLMTTYKQSCSDGKLK